MLETTMSILTLAYIMNASIPLIALLLEKLYNFSFMKSSYNIEDKFLSYQRFKYDRIMCIQDFSDGIIATIILDTIMLGVCLPFISLALIYAPWILAVIAIPFVLRYITSRRKGKDNA